MPAKKGRAWKMERASVSRKGSGRPRSNKYSKFDSKSKLPAARTRKRIWIGGHIRNGNYVRGHYRNNPNYKKKMSRADF